MEDGGGGGTAVQAGPNGPENVSCLLHSIPTLADTVRSQNHDLNFAYSTTLGETWLNNWNQTIANMSAQQPIRPSSAGIVMFGIPKYGSVYTFNDPASRVAIDLRLQRYPQPGSPDGRYRRPAARS